MHNAAIEAACFGLAPLPAIIVRSPAKPGAKPRFVGLFTPGSPELGPGNGRATLRWLPEAERSEVPEQPGRLREVELFVLVVGDHALTRGAPPPGLHGRAALRVAGRGGAVGVARPPAGDQAERAGEFLAGGAQLVDEPGRALGVRTRDHQRVALELAEALGEHVGGDPGHLLLEVAESPRAVEQRGDHQQRPAVPDGGERVGQRRPRVRVEALIDLCPPVGHIQIVRTERVVSCHLQFASK